MGGSRPTVWITRTLPGAALTAARVQALGWTPWARPLLTVRLLDVPITLTGVGALAFTSPNGVAAFSRLRDERALPVFAVGDGTADAARAAGFDDVQSAAGDIHDLVALIQARRETFSGVLLRPGAREPAGDLDGALSARGVEAASCAVYETIETNTDSNSLEMRRLVSGELAAVLVHSPRAGRRLAGLIREPVCTRIICISAAAAKPLIKVGCTVAVAAHPSENGVLAALGSGLPASQRPPGAFD
jgi:uroporphyrinogen-III synthase